MMETELPQASSSPLNIGEKKLGGGSRGRLWEIDTMNEEIEWYLKAPNYMTCHEFDQPPTHPVSQ